MAAFQAEATTSGKPRLLLTAAVGAGKPTIDAAYDIPAICRYYTTVFNQFSSINNSNLNEIIINKVQGYVN